MVSTVLTRLHTTVGLLTLFLLTASSVFSQNIETFTEIPTTSPGSYSARTWIGDNNETWSATDARTDQTINGKAILVRNGTLTTTIPGGIGDLILTTQRKFGGGSGVLTVSVNGNVVGTIPYGDIVQTNSIMGINVSGNAVLSVETPGNGDRVAMDDLTWTSYAGGGNAAPLIANITQVPGSNISSSDAVSVSADLIDSDGIASAELRWGTVSGNLTNTIVMNNTAGDTYATATDIPAQADGTTVYYEIEATDNNAAPLSTTSAEQSYTITSGTIVGDVETFTNLQNATGDGNGNSNSYQGWTWTGDNNETWSATDARTDQTINGKAILVRDGILTTTIPGGIGDLMLTTQRQFGGGSGVLTVSVNGNVVGTIPYDDTVQTNSIMGINVSGNAVLSVETPGNGDRVAMDDLTWTSYVGGGNAAPLITNITQVPGNNITSSDAVSVSADLIDSDGIASAELRWGTVSGNLTNTIVMNNTAGDTYATATDIPAQADGTTVYYEIEATDNNAAPLSSTSTEQSYTVADPLPFVIPYFNAFDDQTDYDEAVGYGFGFNNANQNGSYVLIDGGSIVSPAIDFSVYAELTVSFDIGTYGGSTGQELGVFVSNDNGVNYTLLGTFSPTSSTPSGFDQKIDLISLNGTSGRIKFEQTAGTNSIRFKNLNIEESQANVGPVITNIVQNPVSVTSSDAVSVSADLIDSDGIASAELRWGTVSGNLTNTIVMNNTTGDTYATATDIPAQADGTTVYYEIEATDNNAAPLSSTSTEQSYMVSDPVPLVLPYSNGLRNQIDYDEAVNFGFEFTSTILETGSGGYIRITNGGSIETPAIDFSLYNQLEVSFDMTTYGGNSGQELSILVSDDNGITYTLVETYAVPPSYLTFQKIIDLATLNGINGRIKFEMTKGANSIRFRDISLQDFAGYYYSNGVWTPSDPDGISTASDDIYVADGTTTFTSNTTARNITVNTGATLNIESILTIVGDITNNGDLVFISSATANGELAEVPNGSNINGTVTVQNYMSLNRAYRMVSSPVTTPNSIHDNWQEGAISATDNPASGFGTHITGTLIDQQNGFDATITGNPSMFVVDVANQVFEPIDNTDVNTLTAGEPFLLFVRGDRSIDLTDDTDKNETVLRATGTMLTGSNTQTYTGANGAGDFVMFGNPYQSAVDITTVFANSTNINSGYYYVYDPTLGDHGAYITIDLSDTTANKYLQPGQAAQVATSAAGSVSIVFGESDKAPGNFVASSVNGQNADNALTVQLYTEDHFNNGGPLHDNFRIIFEQGNDNGLTPEDAVKPLNFYENLGIDLAGTLLSIENRDMPQPGEIFNLFSNGYEFTDYVLKMTVDGLDDVVLFLDDHYTGDSQKLDVGDNNYAFSVDSTNTLSIAVDRFSIRVEQRLGVDTNELLSGIRVYPNPVAGNTFYINAPKLDGKQLDVRITELTGRSIYEETLDCMSNTVTVTLENDLAAGIYLVTLSHHGAEQTYRLLKE